MAENFNERINTRLYSWIFFTSVFLIIVAASLFALIPGGGIDDPENKLKFELYVTFGIVILIIAFTFQYVIPKLSKIEPIDITYLHNPKEMGIPGITKWSWINNKGKLILLSFIVGLPIYIVAASNPAYKTLIGYTVYQVTGTAKVFFAGEPAAFVETLIVATFAGTGWFVAKKLSNNFKNVFIAGLILMLAFALSLAGVYVLHDWVYKGQEAQLASVIVFFFIDIALIMLIGSMIPGWIIHLLNNAIGESLAYFGRSATYPMLWVLFGIAVITTVTWVAYDLSKRKYAQKRRAYG